MTLGKRIKILRAQRKLSQKDFAANLGVTPGAVSSWEADKYRPNAEKLAKIAEQLGVSPGWLLFGKATEKDGAAWELEAQQSEETPEMEIAATSVGERIASVRTKNKLSLNKFAVAIGVGKSTVLRWEQGKREPSYEYLEKISNLFCVSQEWLAHGKGAALRDESDIAQDKASDLLTYDEPKNNIDEAAPEHRHLIKLFTMLSEGRQGKLLGYLDALCCEEIYDKQMG